VRCAQKMTRRGGAGKGSGSKGCRGAEHGQACTKERTGAVAVRAALESAVQLGRGDEGNRQSEMANPTKCRDSLQPLSWGLHGGGLVPVFLCRCLCTGVYYLLPGNLLPNYADFRHWTRGELLLVLVVAWLTQGRCRAKTVLTRGAFERHPRQLI
jgi:hypothetical protein